MSILYHYVPSSTIIWLILFSVILQQPSVVDILKSQMTEVAKAKKEGTITTADGNPFSTSNFLRQFRDKDSRELQQLSAAQFMKVWEHYDEDGKLFLIVK